MSKVLILEKLKLVVMLKKKGVSKLKMRLLKKIRFSGVSTLIALTACNDEILVESTTIFEKSSGERESS